MADIIPVVYGTGEAMRVVIAVGVVAVVDIAVVDVSVEVVVASVVFAPMVVVAVMMLLAFVVGARVVSVWIIAVLAAGTSSSSVFSTTTNDRKSIINQFLSPSSPSLLAIDIYKPSPCALMDFKSDGGRCRLIVVADIFTDGKFATPYTKYKSHFNRNQTNDIIFTLI